MQITRENISELNAELKINIIPEDYQQKVNTSLKEYAKKASMPGFRPGKVPYSMIKKMYEKSVLAEEVNKLMIDALYNYIDTNKLNTLGYPLPNNEKSKVNHELDNPEFEFIYELGLEPELNFEIPKKLDVTYHNIQVDETELDKYIVELRNRFGKMTNPEAVEADDMIFAEYKQLDINGNEAENGITTKGMFYLKYAKDEKQADFIGKKIGDSLVMNFPNDLKDKFDIKVILKITEAQAKDLVADFKINIESVHRIEPSELNDDFFLKATKDESVKSLEDLKAYLERENKKYLDKESDKFFFEDAMHKIMEENPFNLPDEFIKRWLVHSSSDKEKPISAEDLEHEYIHYAESLKFQLVEKYIMSKNDIKVTAEESKEFLKMTLRQNFANYGYGQIDDGMLEETSKKFLADKEYMNRIYDSLIREKVTEFLKTNIKFKNVDISFENFSKLAAEKSHNHHH